MKHTVKWFRKIRTANRIFGLEFFDLLVLLGVFLLVFMLSTNLIFLNHFTVCFIFPLLKIREVV